MSMLSQLDICKRRNEENDCEELECLLRGGRVNTNKSERFS